MVKKHKKAPEKQRGRVEVLLDHELDTPWCSHGPCLLFVRFLSDGTQKEFFACGVYRDRKDCPFYVAVDSGKQPKSIKTLKPSQEQIDALESRHETRAQILKQLEVNSENGTFCLSCNEIVSDKKKHPKHDLKTGLSLELLRTPTRWLPTLTEKSKESQFWFSQVCLDFLVTLIIDNKFDGVLCVGAPRLFEELQNIKIKTFLLDFDDRYDNFFPPDQFAKFSMFTGTFYTAKAKDSVTNFMKKTKRMLIFADPPFGGMVSPLDQTTKMLINMHKQVKNNSKTDIIWVFPRFIEKQISKCNSDLKMLEYEVTYENQAKLKVHKSSNPVRLFTTLDPESLNLTEDSGYVMCDVCKKHVKSDAVHCNDCGKCFPETFQHCHSCVRCVKGSHVHCESCSKCHSSKIVCPTSEKGKCHICGSAEHRRETCPSKKRKSNTVEMKSAKKKKKSKI